MSSPVDVLSSSPGDALTREQKVFTMVGALLGLLLAALDQTIVSTAGPTIQRDLAIAPSLYTWITTSYLVASTVCVPVYGKLSDLYGRKAILLSGIAIFLTGSVLCGVAQTALQLILFRAVQGIGAASLFTSAFAVVADLFPPQERGKWQGLFGACFGLASVIGPLAGGFLTDNFGWHWVFFVNLPIGLAAMAFIVTKMPALRRETQGPVRIDVAGALALVVAVVPLLLALSLGRATVQPGETAYLWGSWQILTLFATALVGSLAFVAVEQRAADPVLDLRMFKNRPFAMGVATAFAAGAAFLGGIVFLPLFMVNVVGLSATSSGLTTLPLTFGIVGGNILTGQIVARIGRYKVLIVASLALMVVAFAVLGLTLTPESTQGEVTLKMVLLGLGLGPSIPLFTLHLQNAVEPRHVGVATSTGTFARQMGSTVGLAILGTFFGTALADGMSTRMTAATEGMPAEMVARFRDGGESGGGAGASEEGATPRGHFDRAAVEARVHAAFGAQKDLVKRALQDADPAAMQALADDPRTPEQLRAVMSRGGLAATVGAGFDAQRAAVEAAFAAPDSAGALAALAEAPTTSPVLAVRLRQLSPEFLDSPAAREKVKENTLARLDAARTEAQESAVAGALEGALAGIDAAEAQAIAGVGRVETAIKGAFTDAIRRVYLVGIGLAALALVLGIVLPEVPLRKGPGPASPPAE